MGLKLPERIDKRFSVLFTFIKSLFENIAIKMGNKTYPARSDANEESIFTKNPDDIPITIEKAKNSRISSAAEGTFILPKSITPVNLTDMIYFIVKEQINLYLEGESVTRNCTSIETLYMRLKSDDGFLKFIYDSINQTKKEDSVILDEYIQPCPIPNQVEEGFIGLKLMPKNDSRIPSLKKNKVKIFEECSGTQLVLIMKRMLGISKNQNIYIYKTDGLHINYSESLKNLKRLASVDGLIHLRYSDRYR
ncbi:unnamed protein product [Blepharisma stoltei]|uniref:Autophagy-related protein n=1 Tax=Blepharisma stoltei TaxID=1481888 RepID=A0AAU9IIK8_9CILI|nr:unnamed protein product [Blepharisma stoltei]